MVIVSYNESVKIPESFYRYHREGVWTCPHCDWHDERRSMKQWYDKNHVEEFIFGARDGKLTGLIIVSTCPSCGELTWMHEEYDYAVSHFEDRPELLAIIQTEADKRKKYVKEMWEKSPCRTCKNLLKDKLRIKDYYVGRECKDGNWSCYGTAHEENDKCEHRR